MWHRNQSLSCEVALDIISKHTKENIGILDEERYQKYLWHHLPITDFWHMGSGTANRLLKLGAVDMHGITQIPEEILYKEFGINAEYIIDHAWGENLLRSPLLRSIVLRMNLLIIHRFSFLIMNMRMQYSL